MITKVKRIKSNHLEITNVERKQLSIQFSLDGFSFCVLDLDLQEFILFTTYEFSLNAKPDDLLESIKEILIQEQVLQTSFEKILVVHVNNLATFVPFDLFDEKQLGTYIKFNNKIFNNDFFVYDTVVNHDMVSVFVPYIHINNYFIDHFGSFEYRHYSSILVEKLLNIYANKSETIFFINVEKSHFEIIISKQKKLVLYNTFQYNTKEDFIYYILFAMEQLDLNPEEINVELLGNIDVSDELYSILYLYIRNVYFLNFKSDFNSIITIDKIIMRENFTLFNTID